MSIHVAILGYIGIPDIGIGIVMRRSATIKLSTLWILLRTFKFIIDDAVIYPLNYNCAASGIDRIALRKSEQNWIGWT